MIAAKRAFQTLHPINQ